MKKNNELLEDAFHLATKDFSISDEDKQKIIERVLGDIAVRTDIFQAMIEKEYTEPIEELDIEDIFNNYIIYAIQGGELWVYQ